MRLPSGAQVLDSIAYTGLQGAKGRDFTIGRDASGNVTFATTRPLNPGEGLTIAVSWPKGIVTQPSFTDDVEYLLRDNARLLVGLAALLVLLAYYLVVWSRVGKDPAKGTIIPLFSPPKGFSPAAVRYVMRRGYSDKVFAAAVISMAVKGYLTIKGNVSGSFTLTRTKTDNEILSQGEKKIAQNLFRGALSHEIALVSEYHGNISGAIDALKGSLRRDFSRIHFRRNSGYVVPGVVLTVFMVLVALDSRSLYGTVAALAVGVLVNFLFYRVLKAPTLTGRRIMDQIEGFKLYLSVAEKERLGVLHPPDKTPELYEKYLPFALALDVEHQWSEQFADMLAAVREDTNVDYSPNWYSGRYWSTRGVASSLGNSLSEAISSSASPPGSSSGFSGGGFSGGGFSGGGGGGGGGGGW